MPNIAIKTAFPNAIYVAIKFCKIVWAGPYSLAGLVIGLAGLMTGGRGRMRAGALEFYGGATAYFVWHLPTGQNNLGITLGHVVLGQNSAGLLRASKHERIHVRQFEFWGPLMGPAYLLASVYLWTQGRDPYLENPFEVEAYRKAP